MTVAQTLAEFLAGFRHEDLPAEAVDHAAMVVASTLASAACGTGLQSAAIVRDMMVERGGRPEATVWFYDHRLPVAAAARVNALASDAAASDDSDLRNIVHAGTPTTAAALAMAERTGTDGTAVLTAIVLGFEAAGRIGESITPEFKRRGFHGCLGAVFGSTAATARLLRLGTTETAHALVLAATSIGGLYASANTSTAREYHAGLATMLGIDAAMAAARGFTGELALFEAPGGFCAVYGGGDGSGIVNDLGRDWDIVTDMAIKLVPGGHPHHAIAEAAANAARKAGAHPDDIAAIVVSQPGVTALSGPRHPTDLIDMAHSPAYFAAAAVADRRFGWEHASPGKISDLTIHRLIDKVRCGPPPTENLTAYRQGATVTLELHSGKTVTETVLVPKGAGTLGIDWDDVNGKYRTLMANAPFDEARVGAILDRIHHFRELPTIAALTDLLHGR